MPLPVIIDPGVVVVASAVVEVMVVKTAKVGTPGPVIMTCPVIAAASEKEKDGNQEQKTPENAHDVSQVLVLWFIS